jgi:lysophospholipase L1-like esterase
MKRFIKHSIVVVVCAIALPVAGFGQVPAAREFALHDGDRVMFYGDSITAQRLYTRLVEGMVVSRYPKLRIAFYNAGNSGDTVRGGSAGDAPTRVLRDVAPFKPTMVTISLGANDGHYVTGPEAEGRYKDYVAGYADLIALLKKSADPAARFTFTTPVAYDEISGPAPVEGYNAVLVRYGGAVRTMAAKNGFAVADFNTALNKVIAAETKTNLTSAQELMPDHLHPSIWGHWPLAAEMVRTWGFDPLVSSVGIDAATGTVMQAQKAVVTELKASASGVSWTALEECVPLPLDLGDPLTQVLLKSSDLSALDQEMLLVRGLKAGMYELVIDGKVQKRLAAEDLAAGVNLALLETPMETQSRAIDWDGADRRAKLSAIRIGLMKQTPAIEGRDAGAKALDALDAEMIRGEYEHAQPVAHKFEVRPMM